MNVDMLRKTGNIVFETVAGSHAYGTNVPTSDEDLRGIFMLPQASFTGLSAPLKQVSDEKHDITFYEMRRFFELASGCNPNIIELLWMPEDCIRTMTPAMERLVASREMFLSTKAFHTFSGYAFAQIKKAKGQNKWVNNPQPKDPPERERFCYVIGPRNNFVKAPARPVPYQDAVNRITPPLSECRVSSMEHIPNLYRLYRGGKGVFRGGKVVCDSIPLKEEPTDFIGLLIYNEQGYDAAKRDHKNYWEWVKNRNDARWVSQERGEIDYDAKNLMHCMRLLWSGRSILEGNGPIVRFEGEQRDELLAIRAGRYAYDEVMARVEKEMEALEGLKEGSPLPRAVDMDAIEALYREVTK
jgi:predicted nucleotidyltransferase